MRVVIEIPNKIYLEIKGDYLSLDGKKAVCEGIKNGTPLPKGHGRLIDADALWDAYHANDYDFYEALDDAPTIIEADKQEGKE